MTKSRYEYSKLFDPSNHVDETPEKGVRVDRRDGIGYVYTSKIVLTINLAMATGRPLLISGPPGSGKSSLAASIAKIKGWSYYEQVISSRTQARDLLWRFDNLRRLSDVERQSGGSGSDTDEARKLELARYIEPGVLWWALNPASAARRGIEAKDSRGNPITLPFPPPKEPPGRIRKNKRAVVLLDEIDKADPDVPNDLLVPLGSLEFMLEEISTSIKILDREKPPLVIITTNGERAMPAAFLRRCLTLNLSRPKKPRLLEIARSQFGADPEREPMYSVLADKLLEGPPEGLMTDVLDLPSTAEYIDALNACVELGIKVSDMTGTTWQRIEHATIWKHRAKDGARAEADDEEEEEKTAPKPSEEIKPVATSSISSPSGQSAA